MELLETDGTVMAEWTSRCMSYWVGRLSRDEFMNDKIGKYNKAEELIFSSTSTLVLGWLLV